MTYQDVTMATPPGDGADDDRVDRSFAEQLVEQARADGVELVGPGGLLAGLTKQVLEAGLEVEMDEHLGYAKHAVEGRNRGNSRNGTRTKTVLTEIGPVPIDVPRAVGVSSRIGPTCAQLSWPHLGRRKPGAVWPVEPRSEARVGVRVRAFQPRRGVRRRVRLRRRR